MTRERMRLLVLEWRKKAAEHREISETMYKNEMPAVARKNKAIADAIQACADKLDSVWGRIA